MVLGQFFGIILIGFGAAATYLAVSSLRARYREYRGNILLGILCTSSAIWGFGFGIVFIQQSTEIAYYGRCVGMIGVIGMLISAQFILNELATGIPKYVKNYCAIFSLLGIPIYFLITQREVTEFIYDSTGMTYVFRAGFANNIYTAYSVLFGVNTIITIVWMLKTASTRREKTAAKKFLIAIIIIFFGMILDTVFPSIGLNAIPGSSLTQFFGTIVIFYAIVDINRTRITSMNMSSFVYSFMSQPVLIFSNEGILMLMNEAARSMFATHARFLSEKKTRFTDVFDAEDDFIASITDNATKSTVTKLEGICVELSVGRIRDKYKDPIGLIVTVKDMTQINEMMDSLHEAKTKAEEASIAKSVFLANTSHEIRTPLNAIMGFSELLIGSGLSGEQKDFAEDIKSSSQNLLAIINDILDISKIESGRMELTNAAYNLSEVLRDVCIIIDNQAKKKNLEFKYEFDENMPSELLGDIVRVRGILINVLNNAVKYTKEGYVKLAAKVESIEADDAVLCFEISDTGIGIKKEDIPQLFDSFSQVDKKVNRGIEGTGLGLAIVKGYVNLMSGSIKVDSEYGKGSTFIVKIHQKVVGTQKVGQAYNMNITGKQDLNISEERFPGIRVLSVDDNRMNLKLVEKSLSKYGMNVTSASGGQEAIDKCRDNLYDVVLMDQMMPVIDGVTAMKEIRKLSEHYAKGSECLIVALTANAVTGVREELLAEGFDNYISKPMNFAEVEQLFSDYVESKSNR